MTRTASAVHSRHASGRFSGKLTLSGKNSGLTWTLTFAHLTGSARRAGIYFGKAAKPSQLALLLCNGCRSGATSYYHGSYVASGRFARAILRGRAYVVIQTRRNPRGEVRGRIRAKAG
ncbi:MAG TPA: CHRD domain-containing protein [Gaiellaceae bacterium]